MLPAFIAVTVLAAGYAEAQSRRPNVEAVFFTSNPVRGDTYERGEKIEVTVRFDRSVVWSDGRTELALTVGDHTRYAQAHSSDIDGRELRFFYTVRAEDRDGDGIGIPANALSLNGGSITLAGDAETDAVLIHDAVGTFHFGRVDGTASSAHDLRTAAVRLRNRVTEFAADILSNFVSSVRYRTYPVDADPCPPAN